MPSLRDVTVIFVTYNSAGCIAGALAAVPREMPAIVVDNASRDDTLALARGARADVRIEANAANVGYGTALNIGARLAQTPFVLLSNPDIVMSPVAVEQMLEAAGDFPRSFLFSPLVHDHKGEPEEFTRGGLFSKTHPLFKPLAKRGWTRAPFPERPVAVEWIGGCVMLARREPFLACGGFDEKIFLFFEETDLCYRAAQAGHPPVFVPTAPMQHLSSLSSGEVTVEKLYFRQWHFSWSRFYLARKYAGKVPWWQPVVYPLQYALKYWTYRLTGKAKKAAYYRAQRDGALAALRGRAAKITSPWDKDLA